MHRLVATSFKTIMFTIIFIFVWDMAFYLYRAVSLNQRMESLMTSMQKVIMENNYLPEGDYEMYVTILQQLAADMNGTDAADRFINGFYTNYENSPRGAVLGSLNASRADERGVRTTNILRDTMSVPANYGDVMIAQIGVNINQPLWNWSNGTVGNYNYDGQDAAWVGGTNEGFTRVGYATTTFYYTYYVPCLKYQSISDVY